MENLNSRQKLILEFIQKNPDVGNQEIKEHLAKTNDPVSRITITRDLQELLGSGFIETKGQGRNVHYREKVQNPALSYLDPQSYFQLGPDERQLTYDRFNWSVFDCLDQLFTTNELKNLEDWNHQYQQNLNQLSNAQIKKEFERLTIELSWKSSQIEGNTYSLIDTEILIQENKEAAGHNKKEAIMILNHKKAL